MGVDRRSKMGLKRYLNPSDRFKVLLVEHFLLPFKFCYDINAISVVLVGVAYFEENRLVEKFSLVFGSSTDQPRF